ncbi:MAG: homoserine O-acetyltransferase [Actinobacteria bacterium]|nr:MAG: homoserine O-acetyltransferase [Actinomycetota bacterium]
MRTGDLGVVRTEQLFVPGPVRLESGRTLPRVTIAYETYGHPNADRSNAILVLHALSGDAHAAGVHSKSDAKPGWWDSMIGPGKAFDTNRYFVICSNVLGGCKGTTGPSSLNPDTGRPYGLSFPVVTVGDMIAIQNVLLQRLGIRRLLAVAGGSMGGMEAIQWVLSYPEKVGSAIVIAASLSQSAQNIALQETGRQAIMSDPNWRRGDYYEGEPPAWGLAVARMIGHVSYLSEKSMQTKFGRTLRNNGGRYAYDFSEEFEVQGYLAHQGSAFVKRFDANSYLYITKAIDYFNVEQAEAVAAFARSSTDFLAISFSSDWLYPSGKVKEIVTAARRAGRKASYCEIRSDYGHDAFLLEEEKQTPIVRNFLRNQEVRACNAEPILT